jgi:aminoglycoside 3-N-acetyltransferase I
MLIRRLSGNDGYTALKLCEMFKEMKPSASYLSGLLDNDRHHVYVAEIDSEPVGFLLAYEMDRLDRNQKMLFFYEIEVLPEYQGQGIGSALAEKLVDHCQSENFMKMFVITNQSNEKAMNLYMNTGGDKKYEDGVLFEWSFAEAVLS